MSVETDTSSAKFAEYAEPGRLVTGEWLEARLGTPGLVVVESDEDVLLYETGHIPGAVKVDWHTELNDPVVRDYVDGEGFAELLEPQGHLARRHRRHLRRQEQLVGRLRAVGVLAVRPRGRAPARRRPRQVDRRGPPDHHRRARRPPPPSTPSSSATTPCCAPTRRTCSPTSATPSSTSAPPRSTTARARRRPAYPEEGALRAGHIPTAQSVPWARAVAADGGFKTRAELDAIYRGDAGLQDGDAIVAYCRIGERSSHTWFVLKHLLGFEDVRNYDGSWTEWGSAVRVPIATGAEPGELPSR